MSEMMRALSSWLDASAVPRTQDFHRYAQSIANARYVIRRVFRIVDEQARSRDLDPLEHQLLLQIYGFDGDVPSVSAIAERLDIAAAFASRLIKELERRELVRRAPLASDRRVTVAEITDEGVALLRQIDDAVHLHVKYFQSQLSDRDRLDALMIFGFYVGLEPDSSVVDAIRDELHTESGPARGRSKLESHPGRTLRAPATSQAKRRASPRGTNR